MGTLEKLNTGAHELLEGLQDLFGKGLRAKLLEVRKEIIRQLQDEIFTQNEKKVFPFREVLVHLQPPTNRIARSFKADFLINAPLNKEIERMFKDEGVSLPEDMKKAFPCSTDCGRRNPAIPWPASSLQPHMS